MPLHPTLGLLTGGLRLLRRVATALDDPPEGMKRTTWTRKLTIPLLCAPDS